MDSDLVYRCLIDFTWVFLSGWVLLLAGAWFVTSDSTSTLASQTSSPGLSGSSTEQFVARSMASH